MIDEIIKNLQNILTEIAKLEADTPFKASCQKNALSYIDLAIENLRKMKKGGLL